MGRKIEMSGKRYGRLLVVSESHKGRGGFYWNCICDCGSETTVLGTDLRRGHTKSCGCYNREMSEVKNTKHGLNGTRISRIHQNMKARCNNPNNTHYHNYGGRGISVCEEWSSLSSFSEWAFSSGYNDSLTIDRVNNDKGYEPSNCRWISKSEQSYNKRISPNSATGYPGINMLNNKYVAYIGFKNEKIHIGVFDNFDVAFEARRKKEMELYGRFLYKNPFAKIDKSSRVTGGEE